MKRGTENNLLHYTARPRVMPLPGWNILALVCGIALFPLLAVRWYLIPRPGGPFYSTGVLSLLIAALGAGALLATAAPIRRWRQHSRPGKALLVISALLGVLELVAGIWVLPRYSLYRHTWSADYKLEHGGVHCATNLRAIGQAILLYSLENHGRFPDRFEDLLLTQEINGYAFVCPLSNDTPVTGPTTQAAAAALSTGGHLSYVYAAKGLTNPAPDDAVLAYELPTNHARTGRPLNVLYGDGHVGQVSASKLNRIIGELKAGHNPPRPE
jgi:prepilin-type processing-associated H-X9-DG protein